MSASDHVAALARRAATCLAKNRHRLPRSIDRSIDAVGKNPDGRLSRLASRLLGGKSAAQIPLATSVPDAPTRVYVGPTNYAGQGFRWARALEESDIRIGARNMAVSLPGGFEFDADTVVPFAVYNTSAAWQRAEQEAVERFTHVLIEAERPLFGSLLGRDVEREVESLALHGVSCAFLCHGTDIRSPRAHLGRDRWSPFGDDPRATKVLQAGADENLALVRRAGLPVFVSTPDLISDVPWAQWCPVVVDGDQWSSGRDLLSSPVPIVVHAPSMGAIKGTHLVEPTLKRLHKAGMIDYRRIIGASASQMPTLIGEADIVLDQFRLGSYGVAACEAMAAGRVVVGHVLPEVRQTVRTLTGVDLAVVEADPDTLEAVLVELLAAPSRMRAVAAAGEQFVREVHSGAVSAAILREHWLSRG